MSSIELLARRLGITKNELKEALTHYSFYEDKNETKANSRLVFAGMFVFRGQLAEILMRYFSGTGTQLQHILGNIFRDEYLHRLFDNWTLKNWIRCGKEFDINKHKHIFVYAIFGCIALHDDEKRRRFIFKYMLNEENRHILNHHVKNKDVLHQANELAKAIIGETLKTEMQIIGDSIHKAVVLLPNGAIVAEAQSKSYRYARKKAMKTALGILSEINFERYVTESDYLERIKKRLEEEKARKQQEMQQKLAEKEKRRLENIELSAKIKQARDLSRKKAQAEAKKQKAERAQLLAEKQAKVQRPLSAKKRRHLEDKKK